jgi:phosphotransferase system enzyme I (PtsP)
VLLGAEEQDHPPPSLAGVVAEGFEPVRLSQPWRHPSYGPEPALEQRRFHAYLGVPIIRLRKVLGVLEVQREDDRQFDEDDINLLLTVALQLAGMIEDAEPKSRSRRGQQEIYTGTPAAPGVAVGRVYTPVVHAVLEPCRIGWR